MGKKYKKDAGKKEAKALRQAAKATKGEKKSLKVGAAGEEGEGDIRPGPCISTQTSTCFARVDVLRSPSAGRPAGHQTEPLGS
jgi:hypothetical protein